MIYIVLPAYNEERSLEPLVLSIDETMQHTGHAYRVVLVNDGSTDQTYQNAQVLSEQYPVEIINHPQNLGLGSAIRSGLSYTANIADDADVIITMDCDNTHSSIYIEQMVQKLKAGNDVVIASRYHPQGKEIGLTLERRLISRIASKVLKLLFPIPGVKDYTCGYRAYRPAVLRRAFTHYGDRFIESSGFAVTVEMLIKLHRVGIKAEEVPLILRYDLKDSVSKMRMARTVLEYLKTIRDLRWAR